MFFWSLKKVKEGPKALIKSFGLKLTMSRLCIEKYLCFSDSVLRNDDDVIIATTLAAALESLMLTHDGLYVESVI